MFIGLFFGILSMAIFQRILKNNEVIRLCTAIIVVFAMTVTKIYVIPFYSAVTYEIFLKKNEPLFALIAKKFPDDFNHYMKKVKYSIISRENEDYLVIYKLEFLNTIFVKTLSYATNKSIYEFYKAELMLDQALFRVDPKLVLYLEFSYKFSNKPHPGLIITIAGADLTNKIIQAKKSVIMSALITPQAPITASEKKLAITVVIKTLDELSNQYGKKTVAHLDAQISNPLLNKASATLYATILLTFYQTILSTGETNVGMVYRYLATQHH
jgi:hypothetical protein